MTQCEGILVGSAEQVEGQKGIGLAPIQRGVSRERIVGVADGRSGRSKNRFLSKAASMGMDLRISLIWCPTFTGRFGRYGLRMFFK